MERKPLRAAQRHRLYTYIINSDPALAEVGPYLEKYGFIQYEQGNLIKSIEMGGAIAYNALRLYLGRDCDLMYSLLRTHEQNFRWVWVRSSGQVVRKSFQQYTNLEACIEASPTPPENTFIGAEDVVNELPLKRSPIARYQEIMLRKCFDRYDIDVKAICDKLRGVIPHCTEKKDLVQSIIEGGSLAFNALIDVVGAHHRSSPPIAPRHLEAALLNHRIAEKFRYVWIWSNTGEIMGRGSKLYTDWWRCRRDAVLHKPKWDSLDGPDAPRAILCRESVCSCYDHLPPGDTLPAEPCACVRGQEPVESLVYEGSECIDKLPELNDDL